MSDIDKTKPITSDLVGGGTVVFDAPDSEADDHDDTHLAFELLNAAAGA